MSDKEKGFLIVFSEPGPHVTLNEYHDWYDNEHIPLRMNHLPSFLTGARFSYSPSSASSPSSFPGNSTWVAMYDIASTSTFTDPSYTVLRANRSPREADLVARLHVLDRRTCKVLKSYSPEEGGGSMTTGLRPEHPTRWVVIQGVSSPTEEKFEEWMNGVAKKLFDVSGWVKSRSFKCYDNLVSGKVVEGLGAEAQKVPGFIVVHELLREIVAADQGFQNAVEGTEGDAVVDESALWQLYKAYPGIAQGNI